VRGARVHSALLSVAVGAGLSVPVAASAAVRLAIAPFEISEAAKESGVGGAVAVRLAGKLSKRSLERFVAPREFRTFGAKAQADPRSRDIRAWSERAAVDAVVVGRVISVTDEATLIAVEVRSGSSGGALSAYRSEVAIGPRGDAALDELANSILEGLGHSDTIAPVSASAATSAAAIGGEPAAVAGDDSRPELKVAGLRGDRPISINSQELEVITRDSGRSVVFSQDVKVVEGDITLFADHLEAEYPKGESKPSRLVATGSVRVQQGDKTALCDRAEYLREQQIVTCEGNARLTEECDVVRGEEIRFDLNRESVRVMGAASVEMRPDCEETAK
jgi:lipopolysaccharide export system protein LptA